MDVVNLMCKLNLIFKFKIGDTVYLKTDKEQLPRLVKSIRIYENDTIKYELVSGTETSCHYSIEISKDENKDLKFAFEPYIDKK